MNKLKMLNVVDNKINKIQTNGDEIKKKKSNYKINKWKMRQN